jgi:hypothetical protein
MARISQGNALTTAMLQPGAKFQTDGYGLVTGVLVFKEDAAGSSAFLARGQACPISAFSFCTVHKANTSIDALGINTYTVDYVGISLADAGSSTITKPQITGSQGLTTENITAHPNFFTLATGFTGTAIAGVGTGTTTTPVYASTGTGEYRGNNGSTFAAVTGEAFRGFKLPLYDGLYGKTNYLAAQTSFSGHFYTTDAANVTGLRERVGKTSGTNTFNGIKLVPDYVGTTFTISSLNQLLLSQISFEDYGTLYKVTYEVRFNRVGYHKSVYADA